MQLRAACIQTHNADALVDFYTKVFQHAPFDDGGVDYQFTPEQLTVFRLSESEQPATAHAALVYAVSDVDLVYARLLGQGLAASGPPTDKPWGVRSFLMQDPDGNTVSFAQPIR